MCEISAKILNCRVVGVHQSFYIFRQNNWFLENNRALSKFLYGTLYYLISIIKLVLLSGDSPETMRKLFLSTKFPQDEIR